MDLTYLYNHRVVVKKIEEKIERSLVSLSSNRLQGYYSVVITMNKSKEAEEAELFLNNELNNLVEKGIIQQLKICSGNRFLIASSNNTFTMIRPFISKSREREKDTYRFYEPDECTTTIKLIAKKVQRET